MKQRKPTGSNSTTPFKSPRAEVRGATRSSHRIQKLFNSGNRTDKEDGYGPEFAKISLEVRKAAGWKCEAHLIGLPRCSRYFPPPFHHQLHAHHLIPRDKGGPDKKHNLISLCKECHLNGTHKRKCDAFKISAKMETISKQKRAMVK